MSEHDEMDMAPMWKRILAWQLSSHRPARQPAQTRQRLAAGDAIQHAEALTPAFMIAKKSEVALQRELAKVMW